MCLIYQNIFFATVKDQLGGSELYAFKKKSKRLGCLIYFKFALIDDYIWLVSFHENKEK